MSDKWRARVTGKGQVQLPKAVREALGVSAGDDLVFRVAEGGVAYVTGERRPNLLELSGCLRDKVAFIGREAEREAVSDYLIRRERGRLGQRGEEAKPEGTEEDKRGNEP